MKDSDYQHWLTVAARHARRRGEAADLLHDALLDAVRADRTDLSRVENRRWLSGVLRNRAAMTARTIARRRRRETLAARRVPKPVSSSTLYGELLRTLPKSARTVATLILSGMNKSEILAALQLTDTSFRQRLTTIRRAVRQPPEARQDADDEADSGNGGVNVDSGLALGLMRRALLRHVRQHGGVGTHDPDGHLIAFEPARSAKKI